MSGYFCVCVCVSDMYGYVPTDYTNVQDNLISSGLSPKYSPSQRTHTLTDLGPCMAFYQAFDAGSPQVLKKRLGALFRLHLNTVTCTHQRSNGRAAILPPIVCYGLTDKTSPVFQFETIALNFCLLSIFTHPTLIDAPPNQQALN